MARLELEGALKSCRWVWDGENGFWHCSEKSAQGLSASSGHTVVSLVEVMTPGSDEGITPPQSMPHQCTASSHSWSSC
jgi:hypothetical protein